MSSNPLRVRPYRPDERVAQWLRSDPGWTAYALSDLEPPFREYSRFFGAERDREIVALILHFRTPDFVSLLPYGTNEGVEAILQDLEPVPERFFVAFGEEHHELLNGYLLLEVWPMYRMVATPASLKLTAGARPHRLTPADLADVQKLYGHWETNFFQPMLLETGIYYGVREEGTLVAVAGTHTRSARFRLGTIGGVFTHPEYRGRGLAKAVTSAVTRDLLDEGAQLIALNVKQDNEPAIRAYRTLGFNVHRPYLEGDAQRP